MGSRTPPAVQSWRFSTTDDVTPQTFATLDVCSSRRGVLQAIASLPAGTGPSGDTFDIEIHFGSETVAFSIPDGFDSVIAPVSPILIVPEGETIEVEIVDDGGVTLAAGSGAVIGYDYA